MVAPLCSIPLRRLLLGQVITPAHVYRGFDHINLLISVNFDRKIFVQILAGYPIGTLIWSDPYRKSWTGERETDYTHDADDGEFGGTECPTST